MYKKNCPYCKGDSFSAASHGKWLCPYCNADLSIFISESAGTMADRGSAGGSGYAGAGCAGKKTSAGVRSKLVLFSGGAKK